MAICRHGALRCYTFLILAFLFFNCKCYEKIFRKVVRDKSKMVSKPFSSISDTSWNTTPSTSILQRATLFTSSPNHNKSLYRTQHSRKFIAAEKKFLKSTLSIVTLPKNGKSFNRTDGNSVRSSAADNYFIAEVPVVLDYADNSNEGAKKKTSKEPTQILPYDRNQTIQPFKSNVNKIGSGSQLDVLGPQVPPFSEATDFVFDEVTHTGFTEPLYSYNVTQSLLCTCSFVAEAVTDIDLQERFANFDLNTPLLYDNKKYWNSNFDTRYETLMRDSSWPPLKVILVPHSHVDSVWKQTFEQYHKNSVHRILSNIVNKLNFYKNLTFCWNEVSHLSHWWKTTSHKSRTTLRRLVKAGRLEITTGGWVEPDEATTHIYGLVHQLIEGHEWLKSNLNMLPKVARLTNSVTHSPTMPYLLSLADIWHFVFTNIHYAWETYFAEFQYSDFIWVQNWDSDKVSRSNNFLNALGSHRVPKSSVLAHFLQFNSDSLESCGPNKKICLSEFDFAKIYKNIGITSYNIKEKSEQLLEQLSKTGTLSHHNVVLMSLGDAFSYEKRIEFDYQYLNYMKIIEYINSNKNIYKATIEFGTTADYFKALLNRGNTFPTVKGDFMNFADLKSGPPAYWTGFFTSRPMVKILLRRLEANLRSAEILFTFAMSYNAFEGYNATQLSIILQQARQTLARLMDRNVSSGTLSANAIRFVYNKILIAVKNCWAIQEVAASLLSIKPNTKKSVHLQKYLYRDGEFTSGFRTVVPGDALYVFNSLSHPRTELVELLTMKPNILLLNHNNKNVLIQISPVWKFSSKMIRISGRFYKIVFTVAVPAMTFQMFKIKEKFESSLNTASVICSECMVEDFSTSKSRMPFLLQPIKPGDIQIENYKYRFVIEEETGLLKTIINKQTNTERSIRIDYKAFQSSKENVGMFLFSTNSSKPIRDVFQLYKTGKLPKLLIIISGAVSTEVTLVYGRLLQHSIKVLNLRNGPLSKAIYIESLVDYEVSPKNRELELFLSIQSDIANGNNPEIYTDTNGFQYTRRTLNLNKKVESNTYPITTMAFIQDRSSRLTVVTDHAQGVTALQEGQLTVVLDRRVLYDDARGSGEGLADNSATCHRHYLLLEDMMVEREQDLEMATLPSYTALALSNSLNYPLDLFVIDKKNESYYLPFISLFKASLPRDVSVLTFRTIIRTMPPEYSEPVGTALLVLHRQTFACILPYPRICTETDEFHLYKIMRHVKIAYLTNLSGTRKGTKVSKLDKKNLAHMELIALRIQF